MKPIRIAGRIIVAILRSLSWPRSLALCSHLFAGGCAFAGSDFGTKLIVILRDHAKTAAATQQKSL
jgi:hypothetical protein